MTNPNLRREIDQALIGGEAVEAHDAGAAAEIYSDFVDGFIGHRWSDRRLGSVGRRAVLRAAALA